MNISINRGEAHTLFDEHYIIQRSYVVRCLLKSYLIRVSGEISLKGGWRRRLEKILENNMKVAVDNKCVVKRIDWGRFYLECQDDFSKILTKIFGVHEILETEHLELKDLKSMGEKIRDIYCEDVRDKKFAVEVKRVGQHSFTSRDVAIVIGDMLRECGGKVDLENPDIKIYVEIRGYDVYVSDDKKRFRGVGGFPIGSSEKVLVLFSGGFDSTVATWMLMRKGCPTDLLYINMGSLDNMIRSLEVAEKLFREWGHGYSPRIFIADFSEVIREIRSIIKPVYWQIAVKRMMYILAKEIASKYGYKALASGDSIWEANSQTITNLRVSEGNLDMTVLRPVIGMTKDDIIKISIDIGLYDLITKVKETCWLGASPPIKINQEKFMREFNKLNKDLINKVLEKIITIDLEENWREKLEKLYEIDVSIDHLPENSVIIDLTKKLVKKRSVGGLEIHDLGEIDLFKERDIILVCEEGETSELLARELRLRGFRAYSLRGGLKRLQEIIK